MNELQQAIEELTYYKSRKFPKNALETVIANKEKAIPYLRKAIEKAIEERDELSESYQLHFYALFLLGEFHDREFFSKMIEFASQPHEVLDCQIGDIITEGLKDILYNTYNGDIELVKETIMNVAVDEFVRSGLLDVMAQLYVDGKLDEDEFKTFIKQNVYCGREADYLYCELARVMCDCHFVDMLPDVRYIWDNQLMDDIVHGKYDSCVDYMFEYKEKADSLCKQSINTIDMLKGWAMYEDDSKSPDAKEQRKAFEKMMKSALNQSNKKDTDKKIGRNDPCPCGSGKKYKHCCLNAKKEPIDLIESAKERQECLKRYPYIGDVRQEGRAYLEDYYDKESIDIDRILYLGLMPRSGLIWLRDKNVEEKRCVEYLSLAFEMFVKKIEKEGIKRFSEYNEKFSIHYYCEDWLPVLLNLLKNRNEVLYAEVKKMCKKMDK